MAQSPVGQVELAMMSWSDAQISQWQSIIKDGRKISGFSIEMSTDASGQRSYSINVQYTNSTSSQTSGQLTG